ncbi:DsbA family oxidoreductase [uncultured Shimia sp.]|uniref:DsbA family oxidoreductase n=1 Tax=uncultured Shimia sp. TaxID=573152 RepID=UPI00262D45CA|nr:DsbA family oxidoreductase [uncultured Shimia sp.]
MPDPIRVDVISDVVCPWCIVGFRQLQQAAEATDIEIETYWHPFELNSDMPPEGENLREHIMRKYGSTPEQSQKARDQLAAIGTPLGIDFQFRDESKIVNTFQAHQLLHWAQEAGKSQDLKLALFDAYFTNGLDVSTSEVLADTAASVGMDQSEALQVLSDQRYAEAVREKQSFWTSRGVSSVPTMVFDARHATAGAQGAETFAKVLTHLSQSAGAA